MGSRSARSKITKGLIMVATAAPISDVGYYSNGGGGRDTREQSPNYYTAASSHGEPPGRWSGQLAEDIGLTGAVEDGVMEQVYEKFTAPDGTQLGRAGGNYSVSREANIAQALADLPVDALPEDRIAATRRATQSTHTARVGWDVTLSPPKSMSMTHAAFWRMETESTRSGDSVGSTHFGDRKDQVESILLEANRAALDYLSANMQAQAGTHGPGQAGHFVAAPDAVIASFTQHSSRDNDPQWHTHNVILNRVRCTDGEIRAIDGKSLITNRTGADAMFSRVAAERLADAGIATAVRPDGKFREVVAVPQELSDVCSQRRQAILKAAKPVAARWEERLGRPLTGPEIRELRQDMNFQTRNAKTPDSTDWDKLLDGVQQRLTEKLGTGLMPLATKLDLAMDAGPVARSTDFSPDAVCQEAIAACALTSTTWTKDDVLSELDLRVPLTGMSTPDVTDYFDRLADYAIDNYATQLGGNLAVTPPEDLFEGSYVRPTDRRYAAPLTLEAEDRIRQATIERGGTRLDPKAVSAWLDEHCPTIGEDQRAAVVGVACSNAALTQIVGPAGTGKSYTAGALAGVWKDLAGGNVIGLAVNQNAAMILKEDGVEHTANIDAWRVAQERLAAGNPRPEDHGLAIGPKDLFLVDESSTVPTRKLDEIRDMARSAGARGILMGDPNQLGPVEAGGAMGLVQNTAETYTLSDVRRFSNEWERQTSLALRDGDVSALDEYDRRGRLVEANTLDDAITEAARSAAAERIAGNSTVVTADTNEIATRIADAVREHLVSAGLVDEEGVLLPMTGSTAGLGDSVMTRQNDYTLGVVNRVTYEVVATGDDGSLSVRDAAGQVKDLPASYVGEHTQLAYGSTVHAAQGMTVDRAFAVTDGRADASSMYVGMTRGRDRNTAIVALNGAEQETAPYVERQVENTPTTAHAVLAEALERNRTPEAARVVQEKDNAVQSNMRTLMGQLENGTRAMCRTRMDGDLDRLVEDGVLAMSDRAQLGADQSSEHLSRLLRAAEQAGHDPAQVLREAIEQGSLEGLRSNAQGLAARIAATHPEVRDASARRTVEPARLPEDHAQYLADLHSKMDDRTRVLGTEAAQAPPEWATRDFGAVPDDPMARLEWETKAGRVAAYREAAGFEDTRRVLPSAPGVTSTEKGALWSDAWEARGRPAETRTEAALSDGQLQVRVTAWRREQQWAPPHADESLRNSELKAEAARQDAILAEANGDRDLAEQHSTEADRHGAIARGMTKVAEARSSWADSVAVTRDLAKRAEAELVDRGLTPGAEPDRVSGEEWLAEDRRVNEVEDVHRPVTEPDMPSNGIADEAVDSANVDRWRPQLDDVTEYAEPGHSPAHAVAPLEPDDIELQALVKDARDADEQVADRASEDALYDSRESEQSSAPEFDGPELEAPDLGELVPAAPRIFKPWPDDED